MITTGIVVVSSVFSLLAFILAVFSLIEIKAMQKSTHRLEYVQPSVFPQPASGEFTTLTEEEKKKIDEDLFKNII